MYKFPKKFKNLGQLFGNIIFDSTQNWNHSKDSNEIKRFKKYSIYNSKVVSRWLEKTECENL